MGVRIYQPAKNAMQSGHGKSKGWVLEHDPQGSCEADPLMGWSGGNNPRNQICLTFPTRDDAIAYAKREGLDYQVCQPRSRKVKAKNYAGNFAYNRVQ